MARLEAPRARGGTPSAGHFAYYGPSFPILYGGKRPGEGARGALEACEVPITLTSMAEFEAALYWYMRKLGPDPGDYVIARHAARPYA